MSDLSDDLLTAARQVAFDAIRRSDDAEAELRDLRSELDATRRAKLLAEASLEYAMGRLVEMPALERAEAVSDFWEAEARRAGMECQERRWPKDYRDEAWGAWDGEDTTLTRSPFIVWFHANRRVR